jgi:hypothetical protein
VVQTRFYLRNAKSAAVILLKPPFVLIKIFFSELEHWNRVFVCRALDAMERVRSRLEVPMLSQPYIRAADDGTYELLVPFEMGTIHILPYCFHTADEAEKWVKSRKGREHLQKLSARYQALDNQTQQYA